VSQGFSGGQICPPRTPMKLQGIFPPIVTPFQYDGELYKAKVLHNVEKWNRTALAGYVVCGSTGESVYLTPDEKFQLWEWVAQAAAPEKLLIAGTGVESVRETVMLTNRAAEMGYKAAMVRTPFYYRNLINRDEAQALYFRSVADQTKIPLMIYNWPQATGVDISPGVVAALSEHPNIIAVKESSGNLEKVMQMIREVKPGFQVLIGSAPTLAPSFQVGAVGAVLAFANAAPYACITIWEAVRTREYEAARDWQDRIARAAQLVTTKYGVPGLKHAMDLNGYYGGPPRLPLVPPCPNAKREIEDAFREIKG
jgi:4-hydroxy-2-oxoglutarate aldolase